MLTHPTVDQLVRLGLAGMARAFAELQDNPTAAGLGHAEWLALLLDREATERSNRRLTARLRHARLRQRSTIIDRNRWPASIGIRWPTSFGMPGRLQRNPQVGYAEQREGGQAAQERPGRGREAEARALLDDGTVEPALALAILLSMKWKRGGA